MRGGGLGGGRTATRLDHNDGLGKPYFPRRRKESAGVADRLHIDDDASCARVIAEIVNQVAPANIRHRADGAENTEAHHLAEAPVQHRSTKGPALAEEADAPGASHSACESGIEPGVGTHDA